ncbi:MAG: hypothetical protein PHW04_01185 [Candidatus Wallbacteria bacterium]|nr:hypothetical protein [Candidatus Wallbacteria bacterium]
MKKLRIYVDTSVVGGCCDQEFAEWSNGLLRDFEKDHFQMVLSDVVASEIEKAPLEVIEMFSCFLKCSPERIELTPEVLALSEAYIQKKVLTAKFSADALHIALATVAEVDALVSWNFKHIVHMDKIRLFNAVNLLLGYKNLQIFSPREVTRHGF